MNYAEHALNQTINLENVFVRYRRKVAPVLSDINLSVSAGELIEISGRNGAGKSTLLKVCAKLIPITSGRINHYGAKISYAPASALENSTFTVYTYLKHMLRIRQLWRHKSSVFVVHEILDMLGMLPEVNVRLNELSTGNRKKVILMQAFLSRADIILLDEPFNALDKIARETCLYLLRLALKQGNSLIIVSHVSEITGIGRRLLLDKTRLVEFPDNTDPKVSISIRLSDKKRHLLPAGPVSKINDISKFEVSKHEVSPLIRTILDAGGEILSLEQKPPL